MKPTHNLSVKNGEYYDQATGQNKNRWLPIGKVFRRDDGNTSIKLDCIPIFKDWDGWVSAFPIDQNRQSGPANLAQPDQQPVQQPIQHPAQQAAQPAARQAFQPTTRPFPEPQTYNDDIPF